MPSATSASCGREGSDAKRPEPVGNPTWPAAFKTQDLGRKRVFVIRVRVDAVSGGRGVAWWSWLLVGLGCWLSPTLLVIAAFNIRVARVRKRSRDAGEVEHDSPADREPTRA